jgi:TolB protein
MSARRQPTQLVVLALLTAALAALIAIASPQGQQTAHASGTPTTFLISRAVTGGLPNGPSTNGVISNDKRYARAIAFQSDASNIVRGDTNQATDIFVVRRTGHIDNEGTPWTIGGTSLISRTGGHGPANGPSFSPSIDGAFHTSPTCVGFLSSASNIAAGDTNGQTDAFVAKISGGSRPKRLLPGGKQSSSPTTAIAVSGNCKSIAFVNDGKLYVSKNGGRAKRVNAPGAAADPSYSTGLRNDLVFGAAGGVYLAKDSAHPKLVGRGGRNPAYNDIKRQVVAYEKNIGGHTQIAYHDIGKSERVISQGHGMGNGDSFNPVIGNSGYYVSFQSGASNLSTNQGSFGDRNGTTDTYLYTDTRKITLATSLTPQGHVLPAGGENPSMSFYSNYVVFDTPSDLASGTGTRQVFMRYVGGK